MIRGAFRARLLELRRELEAAQSGRDVLDQKRELLVRHLAEAARREGEARSGARQLLAEARRSLKSARISMGTAAVEAAILAQPECAAVERRMSSMLGVPVPRLAAQIPPFHAVYGPAGTTVELDAAGAAWHEALLALVTLADAEGVRRALEVGLRRTARRLGALETIVLPRLRGELRRVAGALDEEERDETLRRRRFLDLRAR
jgi:H(+)-transporting ATP synthase subunit D